MSRVAQRTLGAVLAALPIAFTLFPDLSRAPLAARVVVALVWVPGALLLVHGSARQAQQLDELLGPPLERRSLQRELAGARLIEALLTRTGLPEHYGFRLYLYDEDAERLLPSYESTSPQLLATWPPGVGVTGRAWSTGEYEVARGQAVSDETFGLSPEQQERYRRLQVVAAMPVRSVRNEVIAVLTGSSEVDDGVLVSPAGKDRHAELADVVARVLIDVLQLTSD